MDNNHEDSNLFSNVSEKTNIYAYTFTNLHMCA